MNVGTLKERGRLLDLFRQSRPGHDEKSDALANKLSNGEGTLDDSERQMLMESVAKNSEVSDKEFLRHKDVLVRKV